MANHKFFSYDPDTGINTHETEAEAKAEAENIIQEYRENADEGWSEEVSGVCWGEIKQKAFEESSECKQFLDYTLGGV